MGSGPVEFATGLYKGITWLAINTALHKGGRGLQGDSSLSQFIEQKLGFYNRASKERLPKDLILQWIKKYIDLHGEKPHRKNGSIEFAESPFRGITWSMVDNLLRVGGRELPGGSSLPQFIENHLDIKICE